MSARHRHLDRESTVARLRATPLFGGLADEELDRLLTDGEIVDLEPGDALIVEGDTADALFVVLDGELDVTKRAGQSDIPLARVGPGSLQGEIAALEGGRRLASVHAVTPAEVLRIPVGALRGLLDAGPDVALAMIRTAVARLRAMESTLREREKLAALGTLSAGLAHELNNPAAAAVRAVEGLDEAIATASAIPRPASLPEPPPTPSVRSALDRADAIDALESLVGEAERAAALVDAGWSADDLSSEPEGTVQWLAADAAVRGRLDEVRLAVTRIGDIVRAVKGYAYLDQGPVQRVDVRVGLDQTLVMLGHRLRGGVGVVREFADEVPEIEVYGSELNQVWTNLVDNAIDAMEGQGTLTVRAAPDPTGEGVRVEVCDTGPGIPADVRPHLFEPFYTTKPPGKGTGLGLHIAHTSVARHGGRIEVDSSSGGTCFAITLPRTVPRDVSPPERSRAAGQAPGGS